MLKINGLKINNNLIIPKRFYNISVNRWNIPNGKSSGIFVQNSLTNQKVIFKILNLILE